MSVTMCHTYKHTTSIPKVSEVYKALQKKKKKKIFVVGEIERWGMQKGSKMATEM